MGTGAGLSSNTLARWARHFFLYNSELFRIHITCLFYPAIALAGHTFETVIAVWIVTWHLLLLFEFFLFPLRHSVFIVAVDSSICLSSNPLDLIDKQ